MNAHSGRWIFSAPGRLSPTEIADEDAISREYRRSARSTLAFVKGCVRRLVI